MQTPVDVSLHALNQKTLLSLFVMGVLPLLLAFAVTVLLSESRLSKAVAGTVILVSGLVMVVGLWQLAAVRLRVDADSLTVGGGFYRITLPLDQLSDGGAQAERAPHYDLGIRTNGIGMAGLRLGWFRLASGGKAFVAITDPDKVVRIPTRNGYTILVSVGDPDALVRRLRQR